MAETSSHVKTYNQDSNDPEVIRARIEETRANMTQTVNAIQDKLSPDRLAQQAKDTLREATIGKVEEMANKASYKANRWTAGLMDTIKHNPIPTAMIGIGLGWLMMKGSNESKYGEYHYYPDSEGNYRLYTSEEWNGPYYDDRPRSRVGQSMESVRDSAVGTAHRMQEKASGTAHTVGEKASELAETVQDTARSAASAVTGTASAVTEKAGEMASSIRHTTSEQASYLTHQAQSQARYARNEFQHLLETNPLAVGVVAVAAGAIMGLLLPRTQTENRLMGETRDRLMDQARETAKETANKVQHVAEEAYHAAKDTAKETAKEEAERQGLPTSKEKAEQKVENKISGTGL